MKEVIVAPLNWGLGHASRCIPIIELLLRNNFTPIVASDGEALQFLLKEFPNIKNFELPSYKIEYGNNLRMSLIKRTPGILKVAKEEQKVTDSYISTHANIVGVISDNRFGVRSKKVPSVYMTHQLNVLSGWSTFITSKIHKNIIEKFDDCWIPDESGSLYSGKLSTNDPLRIPCTFIGTLSRFKARNSTIKNDILIILSGPEPNRTSLEKKLLREFKSDSRNILLIQGKINTKQKSFKVGNIKVYNYMLSEQLEKEINQSEIVICRSGYSSIMDMAAIGKKAFFIPTKGQYEQEYLAKHLANKKISPFSTLKNFSKVELEKIKNFRGFEIQKNIIDESLLDFFKCKRED